MVDIKDNIADLDLEGVEAILEEERKRKQRRIEKEIENSFKNEDRAYKSRYEKNEKDKGKHDRHDKKHSTRNKSRSRSRSRSKKRERTRDTKKRSRSRKGSRERDRKRHTSRSGSRRRSQHRHNDNREEKVKDTKVIDKQIEEASRLSLNDLGRQALEAQRDDCTVLVLRLHLKCKERDVFNFFAKSNIGRIIDIKIIRDQRSGKSKGVAYVEFENQESVLLAVSLTGQQILGQSIIIQSSQAEKNRAAAAAKYKKDMLREQHMKQQMQKDITPIQHDGPMRIFVGGLTEQLDDVSDNDLRQLFPFGDIDFIDLDKDEVTGKCRGYAYIQFRRASDARQAIKEMNGFNYNGKILKVGEVTSEGTNNGRVQFMHHDELVEDSNLIHNVQTRQKLMQKLSRDNVPALVSGTGMTGMTPGPYSYSNPLYTPYGGMNNFMMNQPVQFSSQSHCVLLSNLFDNNGVNLNDDPNFYEDTKEDVTEECSNFGKVENVYVDQLSKDGNVWVKFANRDVAAATKAIEVLNGRFFAKRQISAKFVTEGIYDSIVNK